MALVLAASDYRYLDQYEEEEEDFHAAVQRDIASMNAKNGTLARAVEKVKGFFRKYGKAILQHTVALALITAVIIALTKAMDNAKIATTVQTTAAKLADVLKVTGLAVTMYQLINTVVKALTPDKYSSVGDRMHEMVRAHDDLKHSIRDFNERLIETEKLRANRARTLYNPDIAENHYNVERATIINKMAKHGIDSKEYQEGLARLQQMELEDMQRATKRMDTMQQEAEIDQRRESVKQKLADDLAARRGDVDDTSSPRDRQWSDYAKYKDLMHEKAVKHKERDRYSSRYYEAEASAGTAFSVIAGVSRSVVAGDQILNPSKLYHKDLEVTTVTTVIPRFKDDARFMSSLGRMTPAQVDRYAEKLSAAPNRAYDFVDRVREILRTMRNDGGVGAKVYRLGGFIVQWASIFAANAVIFKMLEFVTGAKKLASLGVFTRTCLAVICVINTILVLLAATGTERIQENSDVRHKAQNLAVKTKELIHKSVFTTSQSPSSKPRKA